MTSPVVKRSIVIDGTKTSISIEDAFWRSLKDIATERRLTMSALVSTIKATRSQNSNLSSAIRVYILADLRTRLARLTQTTLPSHASPREAAGAASVGPIAGR